jgi:hypothetical protein
VRTFEGAGDLHGRSAAGSNGISGEEALNELPGGPDGVIDRIVNADATCMDYRSRAVERPDGTDDVDGTLGTDCLLVLLNVEDPCGCLTGAGPQLAVAVCATEPSP